ncbi:MAG: hypothetical protein ACW99U_15175 [Candidatus Thorarchaeota archaeon]|jgi:DNA-binding HxlR family transcriptional regulator
MPLDGSKQMDSKFQQSVIDPCPVSSEHPDRPLRLLEQTGALRTLVLLNERKRFISELKRCAVNPEGVASQDALRAVRTNLLKLGLITEYIEDGRTPRTYLALTDKGRQVAQKTKEILSTLRDIEGVR